MLRNDSGSAPTQPQVGAVSQNSVVNQTPAVAQTSETIGMMNPPPCPTPVTPATPGNDEEDKESHASHEEFSDDESQASKSNTQSRIVTLQMLLDAKILEPCEAAMTIEYLGQKFVGDLLADGKIKSHETETIFCSPSAWAIHCKRIINPDKKSGCGWASVKYKGKKLDAYKAAWLRKVQLQRESTPTDDEVDNETDRKQEAPPQRVVVKHNTIPNKMIQHDGNTLIEAVSFASLGKIQPFLISIGTNACFVLDLHCHLSLAEVCGYLGGTWDINTHNLAITHAFPCLSCKGDPSPNVLVESQICSAIESMGLILVGWYHSHPLTPAMPSLRDCDTQLDHQMRKRGPSDITYTPCVGIICSPYNPESPVMESSLTCYWVTPPGEQRPTEYPKPHLMQYAVIHDSHMTTHAMEQISKSIKYYSSGVDDKAVKFMDHFKTDTTYLEKLKCTLAAKFPREQSDGLLWNFIRDSLGCSGEGDDKMDLDALLAVSQPIPIPKSQPGVIPNIPAVSTLQQMVSMPANMPPMPTMSGTTYGTLNNSKYDLPSAPLNIPVPPSSSKSSKNSSSSGSFALPSGLDILTGMTLGLNSSAYDALAANSLLSSLPPGISSSLAASLTGTKLPDATTLSAYQSLLSGRTSTTTSSTASTNIPTSVTSSLASSIASSLSTNPLFSSSDIASSLFQGGKFPSTSSLLGIPDPMSQSILDANNMYLSPSLLKMQDTLNLLKPLSSSSPLSKKGSTEQSLYLKSTQELMKSAKEYLPADVNISALKSAGKMDFSLSPDLSNTKQPDISISTVPKLPKVPTSIPDYGLSIPKPGGDSFLNQMLELTKKAGKADFSVDSSPSPAKIQKTEDYGATLNLSVSSAINLAQSDSHMAPSKSATPSYKEKSDQSMSDLDHDVQPIPLNLNNSNRDLLEDHTSPQPEKVSA